MTGGPRVVVVGGGVIGASIAFHLTRRKAGHVALCERAPSGGRSATDQSGGLLRLHHADEHDIELAARSLPVYQRFHELVGGYCGYVPCGFAWLAGDDGVGALEDTVAKVRSAGGKTEIVDPNRFSTLFPGLTVGGLAAVAYENEGGYANPAATKRDLLLAARSGGARVYEGVAVEAITTRGDRVRGVRTTVGEIAADIVVLAAGSVSAGVARTVGVELPIAPQPIGLALSRSATSAGYRVPACVDETLGTYFRPDGERSVYFGVPCEGRTELPSPDRIAAARDTLLRRIPGLARGELAGTRLGVEGYTPDRHPLIGPVGPPGLYAATGMSGGGFKIAPAVGELVAGEIHTEDAHESLAAFRPERYSDSTSDSQGARECETSAAS